MVIGENKETGGKKLPPIPGNNTKEKKEAVPKPVALQTNKSDTVESQDSKESPTEGAPPPPPPLAGGAPPPPPPPGAKGIVQRWLASRLTICVVPATPERNKRHPVNKMKGFQWTKLRTRQIQNTVWIKVKYDKYPK